MITRINNTQNPNNSFSANKPKLPRNVQLMDKFLKSQENLSTTRFIQGTLTNWLPKAILSRSVIDFSEFTFLEFLESGIFYFAAPVLGEHLFRNGLFKSINSDEKIVKNVVKSVSEIQKSTTLNKELKNKIITTKGGILLACAAVPLAEYALGFAKNLFTLKVFKVSDFNNVANLKKEKTDNPAQKKRVEEHSKAVLCKTGLLSVAGIAGGLALSAFGHKSKFGVKFAETLLEPGKKISEVLHKTGIHSDKTDKFLKNYLTLDFSNNKGKLALSKGMLALTCITGLFGYSEAAKDRGKLDFYEVWTRVPLVVLYTIFGSALLDGHFKNALAKNGKYPELIKKDSTGAIKAVPTRDELPKIAEKVAKQNNTNIDKELSKLIKEKTVITGVPYLFSLLAMGFTLSYIARAWTKYRYNHQNNKQSQ